MEFEETEAYTPRGSRKSGVSKAASSVKKLLTRRMAKAVSSERALGSSGSLDADAPSTKRFGLRHRRSKTREKNLVERGAVTDRARRSFSFDDMAKLEKEEEVETTLKPLEPEVKVAARKDTKDPEHFKSITDNIEGFTPPETPVPDQRHVILTSSSANNAAETEVKHEESKPVELKAEVKEQVREIEAAEKSPSFDVALDAAATIDAGIEEAVMKSLTGKAEKQGQAEAITQTKKDLENFVQAEGSGTKIRTRDVNVADLIPQNREASGKEAATEEKQVSKPKRRRLRLVKSASFSLATLAVGLLIMILKNKN